MKSWVLTVFNVPDRLGGLAKRLGLQPTKKNPAHWWRRFDPPRSNNWSKARRKAKRVLTELNAAGLNDRSWMQVEVKEKPAQRLGKSSGLRGLPELDKEYAPRPKTFRGYIDFATHNSSPSRWRMRRGKRP